MSSHFNVESTAGSASEIKQLRNELALAQQEAQKWKEKYLMEKRRRQKTSRDLLDLALRTEEKNIKLTDLERSSLLFTSSNHPNNLLSPTLSSFDFDDDSNEDDSDDMVRSLKLQQDDGVKQTDKEKLETIRSPTRTDTGSGRRMHRSLAAGSALKDRGEVFPRSLNELWHARTCPNKLQTATRSILFSMHLKKEHIFERFFVTGITLHDTLCAKIDGYYKPKLLYGFPNRINELSDKAVAEFCFPRDVPLLACRPDQVASLCGMAVSQWFTEINALEKRLKYDLETAGYTFRLTGAKGEVLYGFCAAIMQEVMADVSVETSNCVNGNSVSSSSERSPTNVTTNVYMAPMCYCITSKFPFYRFHFALLRQAIENELEQHRLQSSASLQDRTIEDEEFEITLRPLLALTVEFTISYEDDQKWRNLTSSSESNDKNNLASIATKLLVSPLEGHIVLREDTAVSASKLVNTRSGYADAKKQPIQYRKSHSTGTDNTTSARILHKPMVTTISSSLPKEYDRVKVGDILEAVDGIATASMSLDETLRLLEKGDRPMIIRFRRSNLSAQASSSTCVRLKSRDYLSPSSIDILYRARRMKINEPGLWSTVRLPMYDFSYQFPKRLSDRWSVGVILRLLTPQKVVEIMGYLLLEKQVVIMSNSHVKVSAVCTAFLLLLAPFQWQSTYIPLLPMRLLDFMHSPVPFLMGCHSLCDTSEWSDVCFYNIDSDLITVPAATRHLRPSLIPNGEELCRLFRIASNRFCALRPTTRPWYELSDEQDTIVTLTMQEAEIFLRDMACDISFQDLAASISGGQNFYDRLQEEVAKEVHNSVYKEYLEEFTQTQMFYQYHERLYQSVSINSVLLD